MRLHIQELSIDILLTGDPVSYTNWLPGHTSNFVSHSQEDCVVIIPYKNGQWDDIPCGHYGFLGESGETHQPLCEYSKGPYS